MSEVSLADRILKYKAVLASLEGKPGLEAKAALLRYAIQIAEENEAYRIANLERGADAGDEE